jgi:hypothetical protein
VKLLQINKNVLNAVNGTFKTDPAAGHDSAPIRKPSPPMSMAPKVNPSITINSHIPSFPVVAVPKEVLFIVIA